MMQYLFSSLLVFVLFFARGANAAPPTANDFAAHFSVVKALLHKIPAGDVLVVADTQGYWYGKILSHLGLPVEAYHPPAAPNEESTHLNHFIETLKQRYPDRTFVTFGRFEPADDHAIALVNQVLTQHALPTLPVALRFPSTPALQSISREIKLSSDVAKRFDEWADADTKPDYRNEALNFVARLDHASIRAMELDSAPSQNMMSRLDFFHRTLPHKLLTSLSDDSRILNSETLMRHLVEVSQVRESLILEHLNALARGIYIGGKPINQLQWLLLPAGTKASLGRPPGEARLPTKLRQLAAMELIRQWRRAQRGIGGRMYPQELVTYEIQRAAFSLMRDRSVESQALGFMIATVFDLRLLDHDNQIKRLKSAINSREDGESENQVRNYVYARTAYLASTKSMQPADFGYRRYPYGIDSTDHDHRPLRFFALQKMMEDPASMQNLLEANHSRGGFLRELLTCIEGAVPDFMLWSKKHSPNFFKVRGIPVYARRHAEVAQLMNGIGHMARHRATNDNVFEDFVIVSTSDDPLPQQHLQLADQFLINGDNIFVKDFLRAYLGASVPEFAAIVAADSEATNDTARFAAAAILANHADYQPDVLMALAEAKLRLRSSSPNETELLYLRQAEAAFLAIPKRHPDYLTGLDKMTSPVLRQELAQGDSVLSCEALAKRLN